MRPATASIDLYRKINSMIARGRDVGRCLLIANLTMMPQLRNDYPRNFRFNADTGVGWFRFEQPTVLGRRTKAVRIRVYSSDACDAWKLIHESGLRRYLTNESAHRGDDTPADDMKMIIELAESRGIDTTGKPIEEILGELETL